MITVEELSLDSCLGVTKEAATLVCYIVSLLLSVTHTCTHASMQKRKNPAYLPILNQFVSPDSCVLPLDEAVCLPDLQARSHSRARISSQVCQSCTKLTCLSLANCQLVEDSVALTISLKIRKLAKLDLSGCRHVGNEAASQIVSRNTQLKELLMYGCPRIGDPVLEIVSTHMRRVSFRLIDSLIQSCQLPQ